MHSLRRSRTVGPAVAANPPGPVLPDSLSSVGSRSTRSCLPGEGVSARGYGLPRGVQEPRADERAASAHRRCSARRCTRESQRTPQRASREKRCSACSRSRWRWTFGGSHGPGGGLVSKAPCGWGRGCRGGSPRAPGTSPHRPGNRSLEPNSEPPLPRGLTTPGTRRLSWLSRSNSGWEAQGPTVPGPAPRRRLT